MSNGYPHIFLRNRSKGSGDEDELMDIEENRKSRNSKKSIGRRSSRQSFNPANGRRKSTVAFAGEDISDEEDRQMKCKLTLDRPLFVLWTFHFHKPSSFTHDRPF